YIPQPFLQPSALQMVLHNIPRQVPHSSDRNPQPAPRIEAVHFAEVWSLPDTPLRYCCSCSPVPQWIPHPEVARSIPHPEAARSILQSKAVPPTPPQSGLPLYLPIFREPG